MFLDRHLCCTNTEMTTTLGKLFMQQWTTCVQAYFSLTALLLSRRGNEVSCHYIFLDYIYLVLSCVCIIFQILVLLTVLYFSLSQIFFLQFSLLCSRVCNWFVKWSTFLRSSWTSICCCCWVLIHDILCQQMWYIYKANL